MTKKVAIILNSSWNIVNFRAGLLKALYKSGYELIAIAPSDEYSTRLSSLHCRHLSVPMKATGINPISDTFLLIHLWFILRRERPDIILTYTVKPNIYGSIAGHSLGIPVLCNIAGLGAGFSRGIFLRSLITRLFKFALRHAELVFFQNNEDLNHFIEVGITQQDRSKRLPGSGINLQQFPPRPSGNISSAAKNNRVTFILIAR
ncbi:MAG TPA: glycosyltransferase, partial [Methanosarcina sp.]|nr:glycosyltransferase [Methanosarcina sp.]